LVGSGKRSIVERGERTQRSCHATLENRRKENGLSWGKGGIRNEHSLMVFKVSIQTALEEKGTVPTRHRPHKEEKAEKYGP